MLTSIIENYLLSIKEIQFFRPFINLLDVIGYKDIHLLHGPNEFGKDIIAKKDGKQFAFVIKVGDVNQTKFMKEVKGQLLEAQTNTLAYPNFDFPISKVIFVTTGNLTPQVGLSLQNYNEYSTNKDLPLIDVWTRDFLIKEFSGSGIEPFFNLHSNPQFIIDFYDTYTKIIKDEIFQSFDVERLSKKWLKFDFSVNLNRLQIFFEAFYFSKLLIEKNRNYEALLFISALVRVLSVNDIFPEYEAEIKKLLIEIIINATEIFNLNSISEELNKVDGFFDIFYYPERCLELSELLAIGIILGEGSLEEKFSICIKEKGCYRPLSDNYAVTIVFVALALIKSNLIEELRKYVNNCSVWLCDRYEELGIAPIGSNKELEYSQLLSEYLEGYTYYKNSYSLIATILLDICFIIKDSNLFGKIGNEFRAVEISPVFYHIIDEKDLWDYDNIVTEHDPLFKIDELTDYSNMCDKYGRNNLYVNKMSTIEIVCNVFLLRDRYFPYSGMIKLAFR